MAQRSQPDFDVLIVRNAMAPMRDGTRLATDVYLPARGGEPAARSFPAVLTRTPYDKSTQGTMQNAEYWARRGYVRVVQDVRGRFASEGDFYLLKNEAEDGYDTIDWLAGQAWSNGRIGMEGTSYPGWVQSAAASLNPPNLSAMWVNQGAFNGLTSSLRHGGALELRWMAWAYWNAPVSVEAARDPTVAAELRDAAVRLREWLLRLPVRSGETPLAALPNYERWVIDLFTQCLESDELWQSPSLNFEAFAEQAADVPTVYCGGWFDSYTRATTESWMRFQEIKESPQYLVMGPWVHGDATPARSFSGDVDLGPAAPVTGNLAAGVLDHRMRFFDRFLKDFDSGWEEQPPVEIFVMGGGGGRKLSSGRLEHGGGWREEPIWPLERAEPTAFYLHADGGLRRAGPKGGAEASRYEYDPEHPVPTISANVSSLRELVMEPERVEALSPPTLLAREVVMKGSADQRERPDVFGAQPPYRPLAERPDVLVFEAELLTEDIEVTGPITVTLWVSTSAPDTDFTAALLDVYPASSDYPEGYALRLSDSIKRLRFRNGYSKEELVQPDEIVQMTIELYPTSNVFAAGHRIRLDISSSNFPRFDPNPNTGEPLGRHTRTVVARNAVYHDENHPSQIELPIVP